MQTSRILLILWLAASTPGLAAPIDADSVNSPTQVSDTDKAAAASRPASANESRGASRGDRASGTDLIRGASRGDRASGTDLISLDALQSLSQSSSQIPNLRMVSSRVLRGGQPTEQGMLKLKQAGVKTIINLRTEPVLVENERRLAERLKMNFVHIPMYTFEEPDAKQFNQFLSTVTSIDKTPAFVHCQHGRDRTGTMVGAFRIAVEGWSFDNAFKEMMACGYRPGFVPMTKGLHELARAKGDKSPMPSSQFVVSDLKKRLLKLSKTAD